MELFREYTSIGQHLSQAQLDWLVTNGVSAGSLIRLHGPVAMTVKIGHGRFEPFPNGKLSLVFPEWEDDHLIDLVAWDGRELATRKGEITALGQGILNDWPEGTLPVRVFRDPIAWLAQSMQGIVIVDPVQAWRLRLFFNQFEADDQSQADLLRQQLTLSLPTIDISTNEKEIAA